MKNLDNLALLLSKPEYFEYFFEKLDRPDFFDWINEKIRAFDNIPEPILIDDGQYTQFPIWWPGKYLIKVAGRIPDKVFTVVKKIETDNISALADCAQAILEMPKEFINKNSSAIIKCFDGWLNLPSSCYISNCAASLFKKYLEFEHYENACMLFDTLCKTKRTEHRGIQFRFELFYFSEIKDKHLSQLIEICPLDTVDIAERRFREALRRAKNDYKPFGSSYLRTTIEDSVHTWRHNAKDLLFEVLRDALDTASQIKPTECKVIILGYLAEENTIFERLAIHITRVSNFDDLITKIIMYKKNLYKTKIYHEFARLLKERFDVLELQDQKQFITWITEGPEGIRGKDEPSNKEYVKFWKARWFLLIKEYLEHNEKLKEFTYLLDEYKDKFLKIDHPTYLSYTQSFTGPRSPLKAEELLKMTPDQFIDWAKNKFPPPYDPFKGSPEGVSRMLEGFIKQNPQPYAQNAEKFLDENMWPTYLSGLMRGLENAIKDGKTFDLEPVLRFIEDPFKYRQEPEKKQKYSDYFEVGNYTWFRRTIASFIEALMQKDELKITENIMDRTQEVLMVLIEKDEDPTPESEAKYGPEADNMSYATYCMNSNRGQAMVALVNHALRRARVRSEKEREQEKSKGPFPPGQRMNLYKDFFTQRFDKEISPSVQSSYGQYLPNLYYLDSNWLKQMIKQGKLFPKSEKRINFWEAHWEGYIGFNSFYNQIYELLKVEYTKAINNLLASEDKEKQYNHCNENLTQHLITAFWRKLDDFQNGDSTLKRFFEVAPMELRGQAILFMAEALEEVKPTKKSEEWQRSRSLWQDRIKKVQDAELANFGEWLKNCPENLDDIVHLLKPIIPHLQYGLQSEEILNYINKYIELCTKNALSLLNDYLKMEQANRSVLFRQKLIKEIIVKAHKYKNKPEIVKEVNEAVNRLGQMGYYDFGNLLIG